LQLSELHVTSWQTETDEIPGAEKYCGSSFLGSEVACTRSPGNWVVTP
jgi:hypothetical protein